jgi:hypothetical protein
MLNFSGFKEAIKYKDDPMAYSAYDTPMPPEVTNEKRIRLGNVNITRGPLKEETRFIILDTGKVEIGNYHLHADMPNYQNSSYVFHGHIYPKQKNLTVTDFQVANEKLYPWQSHPLHKAAVELKMDVFLKSDVFIKNIKSGIKSLLDAKIIKSDWVLKNMQNKTFPISSIINNNNFGNNYDFIKNHDDDYMAIKDRQGKEIISNYMTTKRLFANKDKDPKNWFARYGEEAL